MTGNQTPDAREPDDPLFRALRGLPREDLAAPALEAQRARLHSELARACARARPDTPLARRLSQLESLLLYVCGGCVVLRVTLALWLLLRAGT